MIFFNKTDAEPVHKLKRNNISFAHLPPLSIEQSENDLSYTHSNGRVASILPRTECERVTFGYGRSELMFLISFADNIYKENIEFSSV